MRKKKIMVPLYNLSISRQLNARNEFQRWSLYWEEIKECKHGGKKNKHEQLRISDQLAGSSSIFFFSAIN